MQRILQLKMARAVATALLAVMVIAVSGVSKPQIESGCQHCLWVRINAESWRWACMLAGTGPTKWCSVDPDGSSCIDYGVCAGGHDIILSAPAPTISDSSMNELQAAMAREDFRTATIFQAALQSLEDKFSNAWPKWANVHIALHLHQRNDQTITMLPTVHMEVEGDKVTLTIQDGKRVPREALGRTISVANVQ